MARTIEARIQFLPADQGGPTRPPRPGVRPHLRLGDVFTSCIVRAKGGDEEFEPGKTYDVFLDVLFWEEYSHLFQPEAGVELYNGNRLMARGEFVLPAP